MDDNAESEPGEADPQLHYTPMTLRQARMLDLRSYICGLFLIFGVIVTILGFAPSDTTLDKAANININLWTGLSMLVLSLVMGVWAWRTPPEVPEQHPQIIEDPS